MRRAAFAIFGTIAGLVGLLTFKTHTVSAGPPVALSTTGSGSGGTGQRTGSPSSNGHSSGSSSRSSTTTRAPAKNSAPATNPAAKTVTGSVVYTPYGPVQVRVTVSNRKITKAAAVQYPYNDSYSQQVSAYAIPILQRETVAKNSANIDMVSGATFTSEGYQQSLQSALNKAGL